jgi:hypothetical protein
MRPQAVRFSSHPLLCQCHTGVARIARSSFSGLFSFQGYIMSSHTMSSSFLKGFSPLYWLLPCLTKKLEETILDEAMRCAHAQRHMHLLRPRFPQIFPSRSDAEGALPVTQADRQQKGRLHEKSYPSNDEDQYFAKNAHERNGVRCSGPSMQGKKVGENPTRGYDFS